MQQLPNSNTIFSKKNKLPGERWRVFKRHNECDTGELHMLGPSSAHDWHHRCCSFRLLLLERLMCRHSAAWQRRRSGYSSDHVVSLFLSIWILINANNYWTPSDGSRGTAQFLFRAPGDQVERSTANSQKLIPSSWSLLTGLTRPTIFAPQESHPTNGISTN